MTSVTYYNCPSCEYKGVNLRLRHNGEDHYGCRYCGWYAYTEGDSPTDKEQLGRLVEANPDALDEWFDEYEKTRREDGKVDEGV